MEYVESRMSFIAPNLSFIIGPTVAAKLMGKERVSYFSSDIMGLIFCSVIYIHVHVAPYERKCLHCSPAIHVAILAAS